MNNKKTLYVTKQLNIAQTNQLDLLSLECGRIYSKCLVTFHRIWRKKGFWLSKYGMQRIVTEGELHAHTIDGVIDIFYENLNSYLVLKKTLPTAKPPQKRKRFFAIPYKSSAIKLNEGMLTLSNGRGNEKLSIPWAFDKPKTVTINYNHQKRCYKVNAVYPDFAHCIPLGEKVAGADPGDIHLLATYDGETAYLLNGKALRSKRRYQNKVKGHFQRKMDVKKKGSRKWKELNKAKKRVLGRLDNQVKDILHKQTTGLVKQMYEDGVNVIALGDLRELRSDVVAKSKRDGIKKTKRNASQRQIVHQMLSGKVKTYLAYKANRLGMKVELVNEAWSSKTCPKCLSRNDVKGRSYECNCGFNHHRDGVGSINIRSKYKYQRYVAVVGEMAPPVGLSYT